MAGYESVSLCGDTVEVSLRFLGASCSLSNQTT
jgi:hypothetical protein